MVKRCNFLAKCLVRADEKFYKVNYYKSLKQNRFFKNKFTLLNPRFCFKSPAFTLAEVLITLGIIGVVAALTIPTLTASYRRQVVETRLAKFYSTINQALKFAENDYGSMATWDELGSGLEKDENGNLTTNSKAMPWVEKYLLPYIKADVKRVTTNSNGCVLLYFPDGSLVAIAGAGWYFFPKASDYQEFEDGNGQIRINSQQGRKSFGFFFFNGECNSTACKYVPKGVAPYKWGWDGNRATLLNSQSIGCKKNVSNTQAYCTALIEMNNWKFPKDYPFKI